jgi:release factor glutamine methyltransferase
MSVTFMGVELLAGPEVLVPREETELLGASAVDVLRALVEAGTKEPRMLEPGTGSGNLSCGIGTAVPEARIWAADLTAPCAELATRNVARCGLAERVTVAQGDLFGAFAGLELEGTIDVVVMNPPYIPSVKLAKERAELLENEPREAFDGGPYGISIHQRLIKESVHWLRPGGHLLFEFGVGQDRQVRALFDRASGLYAEVRLAANAAGEPRVAIARART